MSMENKCMSNRHLSTIKIRFVMTIVEIILAY